MKSFLRGMFKEEFEQKDLEIEALKNKYVSMQDSLIESNKRVESLTSEITMLKETIEKLRNSEVDKKDFKLDNEEYIREENLYTREVSFYKKLAEGLLMLENMESIFELEKKYICNLKTGYEKEKTELTKMLEEAETKTDELKSPSVTGVTGEEIYESVVDEVNIEHKIEMIENKLKFMGDRCEVIRLVDSYESYKEDLYELYVNGNFEDIKIATNVDVI